MSPPVKTFVPGFHDEEAVGKMKYNRLGDTDLYISELSLGGSALGGVYGEFDHQEGLKTVDLALRSGINLIDTSPWYGQGRSEQFIGEAVRDVPRQAFYIADKVGRYELEPERMFDFSGDRARSSVERSLKLLGLSTIDLLQVHDLEFCDDLETVISETLPALDELRQQGLVHCVGITGYPLSTLKEIVKRSKVKINSVISYCRNNLHDRTLTSYLPFFKEQNISVIDAGATSLGLFSPDGAPAWHLASDRLKQTTQQLRQLCQSRGSDLTRLAVHYFLSRPDVTSHLMGVVTRQQLRQNLEMSRQPISAADEALLQELIARYDDLPAEHRHWEKENIRYWKVEYPAKMSAKSNV